MKHKVFNYNGQKVYLKQTTYRNDGTLAVTMHALDDECINVITVNLNNPYQSDSMAFLDTNNVPNIEAFVEKNGLGLPMGVNIRSGFCTYPLYTIFTSKL